MDDGAKQIKHGGRLARDVVQFRFTHVSIEEASILVSFTNGSTKRSAFHFFVFRFNSKAIRYPNQKMFTSYESKQILYYVELKKHFILSCRVE